MTEFLVADQDEPERAKASATPHWGRCHLCDGRLEVLVRVEPQANGQPVTYFACERCAQVLVRKH